MYQHNSDRSFFWGPPRHSYSIDTVPHKPKWSKYYIDFRWTMPKESDGKDNVSQSGDTLPPGTTTPSFHLLCILFF